MRWLLDKADRVLTTCAALRHVSYPPEGVRRSPSEVQTSAPNSPLGGRRLRDVEMEDEEKNHDLGEQVNRALERLQGEGSEREEDEGGGRGELVSH